jgi:hypothetical protein
MGREIEKWQYLVSYGGCSEPSSSRSEGLATRLTAGISKLFRLLLGHAQPQISTSTLRTLEREYGYLQLWCDGYGVRDGDLDAILAESKRLRHSTYRLLASICDTLTDSKSKTFALQLSMPNSVS